MSKLEPQIILKADERNITLELGREGKFSARSSGWDEDRNRSAAGCVTDTPARHEPHACDLKVFTGPGAL
jgi:hypothetical protein